MTGPCYDESNRAEELSLPPRFFLCLRGALSQHRCLTGRCEATAFIHSHTTAPVRQLCLNSLHIAVVMMGNKPVLKSRAAWNCTTTLHTATAPVEHEKLAGFCTSVSKLDSTELMEFSKEACVTGGSRMNCTTRFTYTLPYYGSCTRRQHGCHPPGISSPRGLDCTCTSPI